MIVWDRSGAEGGPSIRLVRLLLGSLSFGSIDLHCRLRASIVASPLHNATVSPSIDPTRRTTRSFCILESRSSSIPTPTSARDCNGRLCRVGYLSTQQPTSPTCSMSRWLPWPEKPMQACVPWPTMRFANIAWWGSGKWRVDQLRHIQWNTCCCSKLDSGCHYQWPALH